MNKDYEKVAMEAKDLRKKEVESDNKRFMEVFTKCTKDGMNENDTKMEMLKAGATFSAVNSLFNSFMISAGLRMSRKERASVVEAACDGVALDDEKEYTKAVANVKENTKSTDKSANGFVRSYAKANGIKCFKRTGGGASGSNGFTAKFFVFLTGNPTADVKSVDAYIDTQPDRPEGSEVSKNVIKHASMYRGIAKLVNDVQNNASA